MSKIAMSMRSSSSSEAFSDIYKIRYHAARAAVPCLRNVEKLLELDATIQEEISSELSAVSVALERDIEVTKTCIYFNDPHKALSKPRSAIIDHLESVWRSHQHEHERSVVLKAKAKAIRERFTATRRQLSAIHDRAEKELQKFDEKKAALAKADKLLNEAGRLIVKAETSGRVGVRMVDSPHRTDSRSHSFIRTDSDGCSSD